MWLPCSPGEAPMTLWAGQHQCGLFNRAFWQPEPVRYAELPGPSHEPERAEYRVAFVGLKL